MKLIVGLGNPEPEYSWTRHNVGKEIVNLAVVALDEDIKWLKSKKSRTIWAKPLCYMNSVGSVVSRLVEYYDVNLQNLLVVYDELDLVVGEYKLAFARGSHIHNGIVSIQNHIGTNKFWHLRVGVRDESIPSSVQRAGKDPSKYVLQKLPISDRKKLKNLFKNSIKAELTSWLSKKE